MGPSIRNQEKNPIVPLPPSSTELLLANSFDLAIVFSSTRICVKNAGDGREVTMPTYETGSVYHFLPFGVACNAFFVLEHLWFMCPLLWRLTKLRSQKVWQR